MNKEKAVVLGFLVAFVTGCVSGTEQTKINTGDFTVSGRQQTKQILKSVEAQNDNSPSSFKAAFSINALIRTKKFKAMGKAEFSKNPRLMDITFLDFIFRSPVTRLMQDGERISIYYPVDKTLYNENIKTMDLSNYSDINIDFNVIYTLATGSIPLIEKYKVKQGMVSRDGKAFMLILENRNYYETISLVGGVPDKIMIVNKKTRGKYEFFLQKVIKKDDCRFYRKIRLVAKHKGLRIDIDFSRVNLNVPVRVKTIRDIKIPNNVKIIHM